MNGQLKVEMRGATLYEISIMPFELPFPYGRLQLCYFLAKVSKGNFLSRKIRNVTGTLQIREQGGRDPLDLEYRS